MAWSIAEIENTLVVPEDAVAALIEVIDLCPDVEIDGEEYVSSRGVVFDEDDMEHMDWLTAEGEVCKAFAAAGVTGRVCFGSLEGDNSGDFWGIEFTSGHYRHLSGKIEWAVGTSIEG